MNGGPEGRSRTGERDYSHRSLFDKLGVSADAHVALIGAHDEHFAIHLNLGLAHGAATRLRGAYDLIFLRIDRFRDVQRIAVAAKHLKPNGALWLFHPKGRGATPTDSEIRAAGIAAGLVDNKISAYTDTHTATRYVIPLSLRP